jgi:hypothetical protein
MPKPDVIRPATGVRMIPRLWPTPDASNHSVRPPVSHFSSRILRLP